jgi:hypothetical protein
MGRKISAGSTFFSGKRRKPSMPCWIGSRIAAKF